MSCCKCFLFDIPCLRAASGVPKWVQDDNEALVQAYNDVHVIELQTRLGTCFDWLCEIKAEFEAETIPKPAWWDMLVNNKLLNFAAKALRYYFVTAGLANAGNTGTYTPEVEIYNMKVTRATLREQADLLWSEAVKWLNDNAEIIGMECWLENRFCEVKSCDNCKKTATVRFFGIF